jgi:hypothetical protein
MAVLAANADQSSIREHNHPDIAMVSILGASKGHSASKSKVIPVPKTSISGAPIDCVPSPSTSPTLPQQILRATPTSIPVPNSCPRSPPKYRQRAPSV